MSAPLLPPRPLSTITSSSSHTNIPTQTTKQTEPRPTGGWARERTTCPDNYPDGAPRSHCGHYSFVEMDASAAYRSALAYAATGDERFAEQALRVVRAWAQTNKVFGVSDRNGPLEAAW